MGGGTELYPEPKAGLPLPTSHRFAFRSQQHLPGDVPGRTGAAGRLEPHRRAAAAQPRLPAAPQDLLPSGEPGKGRRRGGWHAATPFSPPPTPGGLTGVIPALQPSDVLGTITDEEMKTGDPTETLRRASMQPLQIAEGAATRRGTLGGGWAHGGITTRQQRKRLSDESHQGPDTPEVTGDPSASHPKDGGAMCHALLGTERPPLPAAPSPGQLRALFPCCGPTSFSPPDPLSLLPLSPSPRSLSAASHAPRPPASGAAPTSAGGASSRRPASR